MPCGGVLAASPLSLRAHAHAPAPPPASPPALCRAMATLAHHHHHDDDDIFLAMLASDQHDDDDILLENGLLSYENPNYHLDPARLDDALNRNAALALYGAASHTLPLLSSKDGYDSDDFTDNRRRESLNGNAESPLVSAKSDSQILPDKDYRDQTQQSVDDESPPPEKTRADLAASEKTEVPRTPGPRGELYAVPVRRRQPRPAPPGPPDQSPHSEYSQLPPGWEKHEDNDGPYYWHIKSGTIQREAPTNVVSSGSIGEIPREGVMTSSVTRSTTSSALDMDCEDRKRRDELAFKRRSYPARPEPDARAIRFFVRSLGWVEIAEEDLTPERSSRAVNKCIVDLSLGRNDLLDVVGRWGDGKDLFMDLDEGALKLMDPENLTTLHTQPIHTIRVWGVGRDNGRDFAYVARDRSTRRHMCHVFRCDIPARTIANTLRDICKRIMIERSLQGPPARPTNLPTEQRRPKPMPVQSFPTPMEEPKKVLRAMYLGSTEVNQATGMEVLNDAIDLLSATVPRELWKPVNVAVAPSMISILQLSDDSIVGECRVRYLSFLGIGRDVRRCAFVMHTAQDLFVAHVFHCEPSSGALCKTIEAACKLRYQKCLDAHPGGASLPAPTSRSTGNGLSSRGASNNGTSNAGGGLGATLKSLVGSLTARRAS